MNCVVKMKENRIANCSKSIEPPDHADDFLATAEENRRERMAGLKKQPRHNFSLCEACRARVPIRSYSSLRFGAHGRPDPRKKMRVTIDAKKTTEGWLRKVKKMRVAEL